MNWPGILHPIPGLKNLAWLLLLYLPAGNAGVVLLYHHVDEATPAITSISPAQFEKHLAILEEKGFTVLPLEELVQASLEADSNAKIAAITFDDAYPSIYTAAYPMLLKRGWPFTIFVATDFVSDTNPNYLSWSQIAEMADNGATIANHTASHAHLIRMQENETHDAWLSRVTREVSMAEQALVKRGYDSRLFAYPYGEYTLELLSTLNDLGYIGFGQQSGAIGPLSNPDLLPRFPLAGVYVGEAAFRDKIMSLAMPIEHPRIEPMVTGRDEFTYRPPLQLNFVDVSVDIGRLTCYGPGGLMALSETGNNRIIATPTEEVSIGRSRYNCTLPLGNRYGWFSQLWIRKQDDGSWYPEP